MGLLFLHNNLHVVHHLRPALAWYRIPAFYRSRRERLVRLNGGLLYNGYLDVARRFLLRTGITTSRTLPSRHRGAHGQAHGAFRPGTLANVPGHPGSP